MDEVRKLVQTAAEQSQDSPLTAQAEANVSGDTPKDKAEGDSFGRFKTKEELIEAYNSLQSEFTKRCQRIKELEAAVNNRELEEKWQKKVDELTEKYPIAANYAKEIGEYIARKKELINDDNCLEKALLAVMAAKGTVESAPLKDAGSGADAKDGPVMSLRDRAEHELSRATEPVPKILPPGGELPVAPRVTPKSIREAGEIAKKLLKTL